MNLDQSKKLSILTELLTKNSFNNEIVTLSKLTKDITNLSKIKRGKVSENKYIELSFKDFDENGYVNIPKDIVKKEVNKSILESQMLLEGDLILNSRGKIRKIGLIYKISEFPIICTEEAIRITFNDDRNEFTPLYVKDYLNTKLITTFLNSMLIKDKRGILILKPKILKELPIPTNGDEIPFIGDNYSSVIEKRKILTQKVKENLRVSKFLKDFAILSQKITREVDKLNDSIDEKEETGDYFFPRKLEKLKNELRDILIIPQDKNILLRDFNDLI